MNAGGEMVFAFGANLEILVEMASQRSGVKRPAAAITFNKFGLIASYGGSIMQAGCR